ncbi:tyrosine-type recombinase/integrase, partial [Trinickia mobilis]|uniref:tyrosine-type recombinase/integrase n=1 Tax=Trinickia mobilis TaxID=2816356 RepID=UPI0028682159
MRSLILRGFLFFGVRGRALIAGIGDGILVGIDTENVGINKMSLTDTAVRNLKPSDKPYKLADGGGMYLHVTPNGGKYWRLAYRLYGKQKIFALGVYPQVSLAEARQMREDAKKLIKQGIDPVVERKQTVRRKSEEQAITFELIAREWHKTKRSSWTESHAKKIMNSLEADIFPKLGDRPISSIVSANLSAHRLSMVESAACVSTVFSA